MVIGPARDVSRELRIVSPGQRCHAKSDVTLPLMSPEIGPLVAADEWFCHQIVETHAHVAQADRAWTEKVCAMAAAHDGSLQLAFGLGKYTNRNVMDGYAGVSRGKEQWTVRTSRRLSDQVDRLGAGPLHYDILEPQHQVRFRCDHNDSVPIAFEWTFQSVVPPRLENRDIQRSRRGFREDANLLRYHQIGVASGWAEVEGVRSELSPQAWFSTRDHSWGVRQDVGQPLADIEGGGGVLGMADLSFRFSWSPMLLRRDDATCYAIHHQHRHLRIMGYEEQQCEGAVEYPDGRVDPFATVRPELRFDPDNRRVLGGKLHCTMLDGSERPLTVEALGDTGFHLGAGLYFGFDGHHHGEWRGPLHTDGEYIQDCTTAEAARHLHQIRDAVLRVDDPIGRGTGWCNFQTTIFGSWAEAGLDQQSSFV